MQPGDRAWLVVPLYVALWDALCQRGQMLSERSLEYRKAHPVLWCGLVVYVAGHLMHVWPVRCDPLTRLALSFGR